MSNPLISSLHESSDLDLVDLKKRLTKDARVKIVMNGEFSDLQNPAEFLSTLKYLVLNNRNVLEFVKDRSNVNMLSKAELGRMRKFTPKDLTQQTFGELQNFVHALFRESNAVKSLNLSGSARKELVDWANQSGRYYNLSSSTQRELLSVPGLKPEKPIVLYRGLLFSAYDLKETKRHDGQLEVGKGLKFLRSIREGSRIVDLEWEKPSSWTTSVQTAEQFARFGPASSSYSATLQWLSRKGAIDGDIGFIISTLVQPDDVLIDMQRLKTSAHLKHGDEGEVILKPGTYTCRVHTKYTPKGKVDLNAAPKDTSQLKHLVQVVRSFADTLNLSSLEELQLSGWNYIDLDRYLQHGTAAQFKTLLNPATKELLLKQYELLQSFYREHIRGIDVSELHELSADTENVKTVDFLISLKKAMESEHRHKDLKSSTNSYGKGVAHEMTPQQIRDSRNSTDAKTIRDLGRGMRFTDSSTSRLISMLAKFSGLDEVKELHRKGGKEQSAHVTEVLSAYLRKLGVSVPESLVEIAEKAANTLLTAERNIVMYEKIRNAESELKSVLSGSDEE